MTKRTKTRCRKLKIYDNVYVFEVPDSVALYPEDIIENGKLLSIRSGIQPAVDVFGEPLGKRGGGFNSIPALNVHNHNLSLFIQKAADRTKNQILAEREHGPLLPQLKQTTWNNKLIIREDEPEPRYFVRTHVLCDNCENPIFGTQTLRVNKYGKVAEALPFEPDDPNVQKAREGSKKLLHPECAPRKVHTVQDIVQAAIDEGAQVNVHLTNDKVTEPKKETLLYKVISILEDQALYSAELARGAALVYLLSIKED